jgi:hypothetical protein
MPPRSLLQTSLVRAYCIHIEQKISEGVKDISTSCVVVFLPFELHIICSSIASSPLAGTTVQGACVEHITNLQCC